MNGLVINDSINVEGHVQVQRSADITVEPPVITISGNLVMAKYIEEINTIEANDFKVNGIEVIQEIFDSETENITYVFVAKEIETE